VETTVHDEQRNVNLCSHGLLVVQATKCFVVPDQWWLTLLEWEGDHAADALDRLMTHLHGRGATKICVDPLDVRPDLGPSFYSSRGFVHGPCDVEGRYPMERPL